MASPAHKIRINNLSLTIWRNTREKGTSYSVTPNRRATRPRMTRTASASAPGLGQRFHLLKEGKLRSRQWGVLQQTSCSEDLALAY
jgi:hypothetical protein